MSTTAAHVTKARYPWITSLGAIVLIALHYLGEFNSHLWLDEHHLSDLHRWVTAHWVHVNTSHLVWNLIAFILIGSWLEHYSRNLLVIGIVVGTVAVDVWFITTADVTRYVGLSGVLNTLLVVAIVTEHRESTTQQNTPVVYATRLLLIMYALKLVFDIVGKTQWIDLGTWSSAPGAHMAGMIAGVTVCAIAWLKTRA